jgi:hypothetical protein
MRGERPGSFLGLVITLGLMWPQSGLPAALAQTEPIFREPFTLTLHVDKQRYYEQRFEKAPYFVDSTSFLFAGDHVGINVALVDGEIGSVSFQKDITKADVIFKLTKQRETNGDGTMLLTIQNKLKRPVLMDALMTVPGRKGVYKTSILPVRPGLTNYEAWPHPIVQLVVRNFRFAR